MQAEEIILPESLEDMQLMLLTLREDLITAKVWAENLLKDLIFWIKVGRERADERLKSEGGFLRSQLLGEQQNREAMELQVWPFSRFFVLTSTYVYIK